MLAARTRHAWFLPSLVTVLLVASPRSGDAQQPIDFGKQIQPLLAKRCFACHGPDKSEGGLHLHQRASSLARLDSGKTAVAPKSVAQSELIRRMTSSDDSLRMPPEGPPLDPGQIDLLKQWIEQGAEWKGHWAFEPPVTQQPPVVQNANWVTNPIDAFILDKLEKSGFRPASPVPKAALLRRVTYDLTGLPPSIAEQTEFLADESPQAFEKVVDRLLQSQRFGEHWARHWLDVVRYAETNSFERDGLKPFAWRYRDYVIRAFNEDKPYDRFIREQLAGDELPDGGADGLIATGFYRLGLWDDEPADPLLSAYDGLDDIISTTAQGFLGLTVNCARCHDHKIDPIPQRDYYSLLAFFQGLTPNGNPNPNIEQPFFYNNDERKAYENALVARRQQLNDLQGLLNTIENEFRDKLGEEGHLISRPDMDDLEFKFYRDTWSTLPNFDNLKAETVGKMEQGFFDITSATREHFFGFVFQGELKVPVDGTYTFVVDSDDGSRLLVEGQPVVMYDGIHELGKPREGSITLKQGRSPIRLEYFQRDSGKGLIVKWAGPGFSQRLLSAGTGDDAALTTSRSKRSDFSKFLKTRGAAVLGEDRYNEYKNLQKQLDEQKKQRVPANYALCVTESGTRPASTSILKRGNPHVPGDTVVPAFLTALGGTIPQIPDPLPTAKTSGRRTILANWIASPENPLTARVMTNRLWQYYFGRGIVRSPSNFGLLGDRPTHPELLDWLALEFTTGGAGTTPLNHAPWSMKRIHKLIVMSSAYRMSSQAADHPADRNPHRIDPLNNLLWRHDMRRLSAEEIRDSILSVDGRLSTKMYGPGIYPSISDEVKAGQSRPGQGWETSPPDEQTRRSIYVHVKRSLLLPILADFDFADPDSTCAARFTTTQPTQALGMLNGQFLNAEAVELAKRLRREAGDDVNRQVELALRLALCREPDVSTVKRGLDLITTLRSRHGLTDEKALEQFCLMTLNLNEFVYLD